MKFFSFQRRKKRGGSARGWQHIFAMSVSRLPPLLYYFAQLFSTLPKKKLTFPDTRNAKQKHAEGCLHVTSSYLGVWGRFRKTKMLWDVTCRQRLVIYVIRKWQWHLVLYCVNKNCLERNNKEIINSRNVERLFAIERILITEKLHATITFWHLCLFFSCKSRKK